MGNIGQGLDEGKQDVPLALRERWCNDIEDMVRVLHQHNIVWGDVSGEKMVIDQEDNIWMVDFGGGWTEGWIDPENRESTKGAL